MKLKIENVLLKNLKSLIVFILFASFSFLSAQNPTWQWAKGMGGVGADFSTKTFVDPSGNIFLAGNFQSTAINVGTINIPNSGVSGTDAFVAKFNPSGDVIWAQRIAGTSSENITGLTVDAAGRVYVSGYYSSPQISIPPFLANNSGPTTTNDIFLACLNGNGAPQFLNSYGSSSNETAGGLGYYGGSTQAIYLTGSFGSPSFVVGTSTITNTGASSEGYLIKFNTSGVPQWSRSYGSAAGNDYSNFVEVDNNGAPHVLGSFVSGNIVVGTSTLVNTGASDIFIAKYDANGNYVWAKAIASTGGDQPGHIKIDATNNIYFSGYYQNAPLNFGTTSIPNAGGYDAFIAKLNSAGTYQWAARASSINNEYGTGLHLDASGNPYLAGYFDGPNMTIGTNAFTNASTLTATADMFIAKFNTSGAYQWLAKSTGTNSELTGGGAMSIDAIGNIYTCGIFDGNAAFTNTSFNSAGGYDLFFAKIGCLTTGLIAPNSICIGSSATITATGATTYSWSTGATTSSIVVSPTATTIYSVTGTTGSCVGTPASQSITVLPASLTLGSNLSLTCKQKAPFSVTVSPSATSVIWTPTTNLSSASVLTPTVTGTTGTTIYTVNVSLNNGCVKTGTISATTTAPAPSICMVTVDSLSNYNEIYWDKTLFPKADSFIVYRETSSNIYTRIGGVSRTSLSMYIDTNRSIGPANGNPNLTFYRYKLAIKDSCGNISNKSLYHETIFNQDQQNGNFNWNSYAIESSSTPVSIYNLKRRNLTTGTETLVAATTGNLAIDPSYNTFWPTQTKWFVDAVGFNCNATAKMMVLKTKTKSNQSNDKQFVTSVGSLAFNSSVDVYPNPSRDFININMNALNKTETDVQMVNMLGQVVYETKSLNQHLVINVSEFKQGVYMINIKQNNRLLAVKKVVIE